MAGAEQLGEALGRPREVLVDVGTLVDRVSGPRSGARSGKSQRSATVKSTVGS